MRRLISCRSVLAIGLVSLLPTGSGCALLLVGGGGVAGYAYVAGKHERIYPYTLPETWDAVVQAAEEMQLPVVSQRCDALSGRFESRLASGERLTVTLEPKAESMTEVGIRVGVFGDSIASQLFFEKIDARLPGAIPPPAPLPDLHVDVSVSR